MLFVLKKHQKSSARKNRSQAAFCSRRRWGCRSVGGVLVADGFSPKASGTKELAFEVINSLAGSHRSDSFCPLPAASAAAAAVFHCAVFYEISFAAGCYTKSNKNKKATGIRILKTTFSTFLSAVLSICV
ncbi:MAG: hypothetical protein IKM65_02455 [Bacteroidaceae bacterium]|nr:hypothetical protein [Bacteroidaceae bacterium]